MSAHGAAEECDSCGVNDKKYVDEKDGDGDSTSVEPDIYGDILFFPVQGIKLS